MKPIKLIMEGFGPYGNKEVIDFTQLEDNSLFLITGATGSGKTTIFDAISYALYGEGSGENREPRDFISQFSDLDTTTQVELIFELKGQRYRIKRIPEQLRYKKVGEGTTTQSTEAELEILDKNLNFSGITDVNEKINEIIGLDSNQFTQIMMIPQGEFRKMLVAESKEREKILQKLFDTTLYENIQQKFRDKEKELRKDIENKESLLKQAAGRTLYKDQEEMEVYFSSDYYNYNGIFNLTEKLIEKDKENIKVLTKENKEFKDKLKKENENLTKAKNINEKIEAKEDLKQELKEENKKEDYIKSQEEKVEKGKKYHNIKPIEESFNDKIKELKEYTENLEKVQDKKSKVDKDHEKLEIENKEVNSKEYSEKIESLKDDVKKNSELLPKIEEKKVLQNNISETEKEKEKIENEIKMQKENIDNYRKEDKKTQDKIEGLIELKDKLKAEEKIYDELEKDIKNKKNIETYKNQIKELQEELKLKEEDKKELNTYYEEKTEEYRELRESYFSNMGAILAKDLKNGEPCPVCGSKEHPHKVEFEGEDISKEELDKMEKNTSKIQKKIGNLEKDEAALKEKIKGLEESISKHKKELKDKETAHNELANKLEKLDRKIEKLNKDISEIDSHKKRHKELEELIEKAEKSKEEKSKKLRTFELNIAKYQAQLEEIEKSLKEDIEVDEVKNLIKDLKKELKDKQNHKETVTSEYTKNKEEKIKLETEIKGIKENKEKAKEESKKREEILLTKIEEEGFKSIEEYQKSALEKETLKNIEEEIKIYKERVKILNRDIEKLEKETKDTELVDIEKIEESVKEIEEKIDLIQKNITNLETKIKNSTELLKELKESYREIEKVKEKHGRYSYLSSLVNGRGRDGMDKLSLERFVQIEFFEDIINAANLKLRKMTEERYYMKRSEEYSRQRQIGLDLDVYDNYTGKTRSVKTLSGGESFKASLALALGLSDVVQSYSGGVQLDTIFIDEGFGSLDPESLENSINCLIDIQQKGRLVGIISHVEELKERIDTRLEVTSTNRGSTTKFIVK